MSWYLLGKGEDEPLAVQYLEVTWPWADSSTRLSAWKMPQGLLSLTTENFRTKRGFWSLVVPQSGSQGAPVMVRPGVGGPSSTSVQKLNQGGGPVWLSRKLNYLRNNLEFQKPLRSKGQVQIRRNDVTHTCTYFSIWTTFSSFGGSIE